MKSTLTIALLLYFFSATAQTGITVTSGYFKVYNGAYVNVIGTNGNVNIESSGTIENSGNIEIDGDWDNDGTLEANTGTIKCAGNYTSTGTQNESTSTVELNGGSNQIVTGTDLSFHDLLINNSLGEISLNDNSSISGTITLSSGILLIATTKNITIDDTDDPGISGGSASSHIVTRGTASVIDTYSSTTKITYPLGDSTNYRPVSLTPIAATSQTWTVSHTPSKHPTSTVDESGLHHISGEEYWSISRDASVDAVLEFTWGDFNLINDYENLAIAHFDGTTDWDYIPANAIGDNTSGVLTSVAAATQFSDYTIGSTNALNPLPINLLSFIGEYNETQNTINLSWSTSSEVNNNYFTIEKSVNSKNWFSIGTLDGAGSTNSMHEYSYVDNNPTSGITYYRIRQTDFNGEYEYTKIIAIEILSPILVKNNIIIFPNPSKGVVTIKGINLEGIPIQILNTQGQNVKTVKADNKIVRFEDLPNNIYLIPLNGYIYKVVKD